MNIYVPYLSVIFEWTGKEYLKFVGVIRIFCIAEVFKPPQIGTTFVFVLHFRPISLYAILPAFKLEISTVPGLAQTEKIVVGMTDPALNQPVSNIA